jgi:hypothetical protein
MRRSHSTGIRLLLQLSILHCYCYHVITATIESKKITSLMMIVPDTTIQQQQQELPLSSSIMTTTTTSLDTMWSLMMNISFDPAKFIPATQSTIKVPPASQRILEYGTCPIYITRTCILCFVTRRCAVVVLISCDSYFIKK